MAAHGIGTGMITVRKSVFSQVGKYDENLKVGEDLDWELRAKLLGIKPYLIDEIVIKRRLHTNNISKSTEESIEIINRKILLRNIKQRIDRERSFRK